MGSRSRRRRSRVNKTSRRKSRRGHSVKKTSRSRKGRNKGDSNEILVDLQLEQVQLFNNNIFYEKWNNNNKRFYLLNYILPNEDIEDVNLISLNSKSIEDYNFQEIIKKYDLNDFIIVIIYKDNNKFKILSKMQLNNSLRIIYGGSLHNSVVPLLVAV